MPWLLESSSHQQKGLCLWRINRCLVSREAGLKLLAQSQRRENDWKYKCIFFKFPRINLAQRLFRSKPVSDSWNIFFSLNLVCKCSSCTGLGFKNLRSNIRTYKYFIRSCISHLSYWKPRKAMMPTLPSPMARQVVVMTLCDVTNDNHKVGIMVITIPGVSVSFSNFPRPYGFVYDDAIHHACSVNKPPEDPYTNYFVN